MNAQFKPDEHTIQALSQEFEVTPRTLRFYEEKGLLTPGRRGQARVYSAADRTRLKLILRGKRLGFTLEESADLIAMYDPASGNQHQLQALIDKIQEKKSRIQAQLDEIKVMLADLDDWEKRSLKSLKQRQRTHQKKDNAR